MQEIVFSKNIGFLIKQRGMSIRKFADKFGMNSNTFYSYTTGTNFPHVLTLIEIAEELDVSIDDLLFRDFKKEYFIDLYKKELGIETPEDNKEQLNTIWKR